MSENPSLRLSKRTPDIHSKKKGAEFFKSADRFVQIRSTSVLAGEVAGDADVRAFERSRFSKNLG